MGNVVVIIKAKDFVEALEIFGYRLYHRLLGQITQ